ncbi:MAG TPA: NAD(P)/FAD-dependent oxidoreductase, partial [Polyangiales bacterium]|nr:NAD(P)/FAD-dependent oxidoreductase [Polyangiales bacterium]
MHERKKTPRVAIVGSGFAGMCMGIRLKQQGIESFTIFEQADTLGGTWRDNDYPGCGCDVQSHVYSFSFEPNPKWSRMFAPQAEIRQYMEHCATKYGLRPHLRFGAKVTRAVLDEAKGTWTITLASGEQHEADVLCSATGFLSRPQFPEIAGLGDFQGK